MESRNENAAGEISRENNNGGHANGFAFNNGKHTGNMNSTS